MGRLEQRPENQQEGDPYEAAETALRAVTEELQIIHHNLLKSLQEDVRRLQTEKIRLADDIKRLQEEKEHLQQGRHISEQQALVRQLAQVLSNHISSQLQSSLENLAAQAIQRVAVYSPSVKANESSEQLLNSLDDTLTIAFNTLQQELRNYQSGLSQQLLRMQSQQLQGETILAELVYRLRRELENTEETSPENIPEAPTPEIAPTRLQQGNSIEGATKLQDSSLEKSAPPLSDSPQEPIPVSSPIPKRLSQDETSFSSPNLKEPEPKTVSSPRPKETGFFSLDSTGLWLIVLSTVISSIYNVAIKVIFHSSFRIFGIFEVERLIFPTLGNSLLILMLRMLVVVPLMLLLAPILHPRVWQDLQKLLDTIRSPDSSTKGATKQVLVLSVVSGCCLFVSQVFIYLAIGQVATGMAITLFFIYPILNGLLSWFLFRDRLNLHGIGAIAAIGLGELLVLGGATSIGMGNTSLGSITAIASGIAFAFYIVLTRICAAKLHPVTLTLINFVTMLLLSFISLIVPLPTSWGLQINPNHLLELILSAFILGVLTLCGYLFNNFSIRKIGASKAAIFGAFVPAVTVILAGFIIQETLQPVQILGVLLVTFGAGAFSVAKNRNRVKPSTNI
jgi:drug/metabolite transporter (DMT)-like permease